MQVREVDRKLLLLGHACVFWQAQRRFVSRAASPASRASLVQTSSSDLLFRPLSLSLSLSLFYVCAHVGAHVCAYVYGPDRVHNNNGGGCHSVTHSG